VTKSNLCKLIVAHQSNNSPEIIEPEGLLLY